MFHFEGSDKRVTAKALELAHYQVTGIWGGFIPSALGQKQTCAADSRRHLSCMRPSQVTGCKTLEIALALYCISAGTNTLRAILVVRSNNLVTVLVVEDEPLLCLDISDSLSAKGYEVIAVANADDAIKALEFATTFTRSSPTSICRVPWTD
jgi:hypothetical protein